MFKFAENLLNNLDQTTQSTVQTAREQTGNKKNELPNTSKHTKTKSTANLKSYNEASSSSSPRSISATSSSVNLTSINASKTIKDKKQKDEDLFENFLNSSEKLEVSSLKNTSTASLGKSDNSE